MNNYANVSLSFKFLKELMPNRARGGVPYLQTIYGYYGKAALVENAHFADEKHETTHNKRTAVLRFFATHWGLNLQLITNAEGEFDETGYIIIT